MGFQLLRAPSAIAHLAIGAGRWARHLMAGLWRGRCNAVEFGGVEVELDDGGFTGRVAGARGGLMDGGR